MKNRVNNSLFNKQLVNASFVESFRKLDPRVMIKNPIMFTVEVVTFVMLLLIVWIAVTGNTSQGSLGYNIVIFLVLLATVLFANFAEAIAEARGKAQADSLRKTREETPAKRIEKDGQSHIVSSSALRKGDVFSRYSRNQYVLMLSVRSIEDSGVVQNRLREAYRKARPPRTLRMDVTAARPESIV